MAESTTPRALPDVIDMSRWVGDPARDLVILAEGNTSIKDGDRLVVKASGAFLSEADARSFVEVRRAPLEALIADDRATDAQVADALRESMTWGEGRPSVETLLHIACQAYPEVVAVIHTHPTPVNALLCSDAAPHLGASYFPDQIVSLGAAPLVLPYVDPGLALARHATEALEQHANLTGSVPKVIYLRNHGMFALGASAIEAQQITSMAVKTARVLGGALAAGRAVPMARADVERIDTRPDELLRRSALRAGASH